MQEWNGFLSAMQTGGWVMVPLSILGIAALTIIIERAYVFLRFARSPADLTRTLLPSANGSPTTLAAANVDRLPSQNVFRRMAAPWLMEPGVRPELREAAAQAIAARIQRDMGRGLWLLETIVTAAPLFGLLGTIVGMMKSFQLFGGNGLVDPGGVTGGVAQSLVATAIGLVVALLALFAFNYFSRRLDHLMDDLELFTNARISELGAANRQHGQP